MAGFANHVCPQLGGQLLREALEKGMGPLGLLPTKAARAPAAGHGLQLLHFDVRKYSAPLDLTKAPN